MAQIIQFTPKKELSAIILLHGPTSLVLNGATATGLPQVEESSLPITKIAAYTLENPLHTNG
jgi:hypothetical protein